MNERIHALMALLALPDPPDLPRGHVLKLEGKPERFDLLVHQASVYRAHQIVARENERLQG